MPRALDGIEANDDVHQYGPFAAGDGEVVFFGLQNEREWGEFCGEVLERPEVAVDPHFNTDARRSINREELKALIEASFASQSASQVAERLEAAGIGVRCRAVQFSARMPAQAR